MGRKTIQDCDLAIIGSGMSGIAASVFAVNRGLNVVQVGEASEIGFASGCLDLLAVNPQGGSRHFENPWEGIDSLLNINPNHPYGSLSKDSIRSGLNEFSGFMCSVELPCKNFHKHNQSVITPAGTLKTTYYVPLSMAAGSEAVAADKEILIVDIKGLKGFSAIQMAENLKKQGLNVSSATIEFPGKETYGELNCERMAWELEMGSAFDLFAHRIKKLVKNEKAVGIPAVLGIYKSEALRLRLEKFLDLPVFEIPTFSPSVPGLRMKEKFIERLKDKGVKLFSNTKVKEITKNENGEFVFTIERPVGDIEVRAKSIVLATGRFFGKGLGVDNGRVFEQLFNLPVNQPETRETWYEENFFDPRGHEINRCGINTDSFFRPLNENDELVDEDLYCVGSILANQDWKREKSGSGIGIASSYSAVSSISRKLSLKGKNTALNDTLGKAAV